MTLPRRILVVHADARARRRLLLVLVEAGYDVRGFAAAEAALAAARSEWFDLALVDYALPGGEGFGFTRTLRQLQPTLPVIMLLPSLELPLIIEGIRLGLTDVLPAENDPRPILRRVNALLRPGTTHGTEDLTADELAEVDAMLARFAGDGSSSDPADVAPDATSALRAELANAVQARHEVEAQLERVLREKNALAGELQTVIAQNADSANLQAEAAQLQAQREVLAGAQSAIEIKSRQLAETRAQLAAERHALEKARHEPASQPAATLSDETLKLERAHLAAMRDDLTQEENRLREEWVRVRAESAQLAQERRRWHDELDQLREREDNLRAYEHRLRTLQTQVEAERVQRRPASVPPGEVAPPVAPDEAVLRAEWEKVHRANQQMEAERAMFRDERMTFQELEKTIRQREERLRQLESQVAAQEGAVRSGRSPSAPAKGVRAALSRTPFSNWGKGNG